MSTHVTAPGHIEITETLLRLYVFLTQFLDRCQNDALRQSFPEADLQAHFSSTREKVREILSVNPVVKGKVETECDRVLALGASCLKTGDKQAAILEANRERAILQNKMIALSDLLAVFRAS
ncbi:MAG: hypothetical protein FJ246_01655 [Nitrospira sp.]|nr:hypothetical protein [Nitrospira sp.]